jgi:hypothetical protein
VEVAICAGARCESIRFKLAGLKLLPLRILFNASQVGGVVWPITESNGPIQLAQR